jgi:hypothetical protein
MTGSVLLEEPVLLLLVSLVPVTSGGASLTEGSGGIDTGYPGSLSDGGADGSGGIDTGYDGALLPLNLPMSQRPGSAGGGGGGAEDDTVD